MAINFQEISTLLKNLVPLSQIIETMQLVTDRVSDWFTDPSSESTNSEDQQQQEAHRRNTDQSKPINFVKTNKTS